MARTDLSAPVRTKVMCMITMDTHSRDILQQLVDEEVKRSDEFQWQS
jgi:dynein heavy chain